MICISLVKLQISHPWNLSLTINSQVSQHSVYLNWKDISLKLLSVDLLAILNYIIINTDIQTIVRYKHIGIVMLAVINHIIVFALITISYFHNHMFVCLKIMLLCAFLKYTNRKEKSSWLVEIFSSKQVNRGLFPRNCKLIRAPSIARIYTNYRIN